MEQQIIRDGRNSYLRIPAQPDAVPSYQLKILNFNQPDQMLGVRFVNDGPDSFYEYTVSGLVSLKEAGTPEMLFEYMHGIVLALEKLADSLGEYMLDADCVCLDPETVFLQTETGRVFFCYDPDGQGPVRESLQRLMEFFMRELNPSREDEVLLLYGLFQKSREPNVTLKTLAGYWRDLQREEGNGRQRAEAAGYRTVQEPRTEGPRLRLSQDEGTKSGMKQGFASFSDEDFLSGEEDLAVYEELGLRKDHGESPLFREWLGKQRAGRAEPAHPMEEAVSARQDGKAFENRPDTDAQTSFLRRPDEKASAKLSRKMKEHSFELGIGAIVAAGVIVFLFM